MRGVIDSVFFGVLITVALTGCSSVFDNRDREMELTLAPFYNSCLALGLARYTPAHTDCVLAQYKARQEASDRVRERIAATLPSVPGPAFPQPTERGGAFPESISNND